MTTEPSPFIWYDLMTKDVKAAAAFYSAVVGWRIADSGMPGMNYMILHAGDAMVGGLMGMPPDAGDMPAMWTGYIHSSDVDADARRAVDLGGKICNPPEDIPGVGRFAVMADPHGATFNLFKPEGEGPAEKVAPNTPGHVDWRDLRAGDGKAAWDFYSTLFHWTKADAIEMGPGAVYQMFATGAEPVGGMMTKRPDVPQAHWTYFVNTDAVDAAAGRVEKAGGTVIMPPMAVPGGQWIIELRDPQGATLGLVASRR